LEEKSEHEEDGDKLTKEGFYKNAGHATVVGENSSSILHLKKGVIRQ
jgi:hypothetical protein